jgi:diguanylate cyclase (GGDEF)-like protein
LTSKEGESKAKPSRQDEAGDGSPPPREGALVSAADEDRALQREETRQNWRLAAILFAGGGLGAILPDALHDPPHPATVYLLPLLALVSGAICWFLAGRARRRWLHVTAFVATLEIALTAGLADQIFATYYTFVAIFVAYVFTERRAIAAHIGIAALASFAPLLYAEETARDGLLRGLILVPTLILAGGAVAFLRERLAASEERYRDLSERDPLTGVGNYRMLSLRVPRELTRHARYGHRLSLFVIDLDDFKRVNDSDGHQRGDAVLQEVGLALMGGVRHHDIVVRQGGDEFAVVAPETDPRSADHLADRLGAAISRISADGIPIGCSMGCARYPEDAASLEGLLAAADARLREAKAKKPSHYTRDGDGRDGAAELGEPVDVGGAATFG